MAGEPTRGRSDQSGAGQVTIILDISHCKGERRTLSKGLEGVGAEVAEGQELRGVGRGQERRRRSGQQGPGNGQREFRIRDVRQRCTV